MREMQIINSSGVPVSANGGAPISNNGTASGSEEGSASPHSSASPPPQGTTGGGILKGIRGVTSSVAAPTSGVGITLQQPHPALRGLTRAQTAVISQGRWRAHIGDSSAIISKCIE